MTSAHDDRRSVPAAAPFRGGGRAIRIGLASSAAGTAVLVVGLVVDRRQVFVSYLMAFTFVASIALGALVFLMICHAMRAGWPTSIRRIVEGLVAVFPALAILFVPLALGLDALYPWVHPEGLDDAAREAVVHKRPYLNVPFFLGRTALFFVIWIATAEMLRRWSMRQDEAAGDEVSGKLHRLSAAALPLVALALSFASFDWVMSLTPTWSSSMFPVYFFAGGFVAALGIVSAATYVAGARGLLAGISDSHYYALGRLLFAFTVFWAYASFFQFMLIWMANRPEEVTYYLERAGGPWIALTALLVVGRFLVPFSLLLNFGLKRRGSFVAAMGAWIAVFHYVDVHWMIAPSARAREFPVHWLDPAAVAAIGGLVASTALASLRGRSLVPIHDPKLAEALAYESP
jgi:hypothetical protein